MVCVCFCAVCILHDLRYKNISSYFQCFFHSALFEGTGDSTSTLCISVPYGGGGMGWSAPPTKPVLTQGEEE